MPLRCCSEHPELGRVFLRVGGAVPVVLNWGPVVVRRVEGVPDDCERGEVIVCCWSVLTHGVVISCGNRVETGVGECCCRSGVAESIGDEGTDW